MKIFGSLKLLLLIMKWGFLQLRSILDFFFFPIEKFYL